MRYLFLLGCIFASVPVFSQNSTASLTGIVIDKVNRQPLEFVNVLLLKNEDSSTVQGDITDKKGKFSMDHIPPGRYIIRYSYIGYTIASMQQLVVTAEKRTISLGVIELGASAKELEEVTVTSRKSMLSSSVDRKVYSVDQDIMSKSGSVSDILKNIPSVEVDIEGNVSLRGTGEVMILINGRPSPLMGKNRAEALLQIPANSIERIEVITNPSARFRPDGTSGIINIVLKKNSKKGFNGIVTSNIGSHQRTNSSLNLSYQKGKLNSFASYGIRQDERNRFNTLNRTYLDSAGSISGYYEESGKLKARPFSQLLRGGMDFTLDEHNSIGWSGNYLPSRLTRNDLVKRYYRDITSLLTSQSDRTRHAPATEHETDATLYWQHDFKKEGQELRAEATVSSQGEDEKNYYTDIYNYPPKRSMYDNNWVYQTDRDQQITVDYSNPISEKVKVELGYAGSFIQQDIDFYVEDFDTLLNRFVKNDLRSNRFLYKEGIHTFYGTYQRSYDAFSFSLGLRAEAAYTLVSLFTKDSAIRNQYFQLYPTLHLAYGLSKGELQLNYSRRVNRPEGDEMNPFPEYVDPLNLRAGNPKLLPEFIHSLEFGYQVKGKTVSFVPSIYYRYKYNAFTTVVKPLNDSVLLTTRENLLNDQSAGLEIILSIKPPKFFSANLSTNIFYNTIDPGDMEKASKKSIFSASINFNTTITISPVTMLQLSSNYRSARQTAQGQSYPSFVFNMGARQELFKKKLTVTATLSDVFSTLQQKTKLNTGYLQQISVNKRDARIFYIGLSYRFGGKTGKKPEEEKIQFDNNL